MNLRRVLASKRSECLCDIKTNSGYPKYGVNEGAKEVTQKGPGGSSGPGAEICGFQEVRFYVP